MRGPFAPILPILQHRTMAALTALKRLFILSLSLLICISISPVSSNSFPRQDIEQTTELRVNNIIKELRLHEKVQLLHGKVSGYIGWMKGIKRLGIPDLYLNDGPQGFRGIPGTSVAWPSGLAQAATWNPTLIQRMAVALGHEFREKGANIILGPALCIARVPTNGRTFEYLSGESPLLGARMTQAYVTGAQSVGGMIATAKHFILNNQETDRMRVSSEVEDYVLHELYLPPFEAAVNAGVLAVMCSYNKVNGVHACESEYTIQQVLREQLGFKGYVMSDWFATHSTFHAQHAGRYLQLQNFWHYAASLLREGLDQEMPVGLYYGLPLYAAAKFGLLKEELIDDKVKHILYTIVKANITQAAHCKGCLWKNTVTRERVALAKEIAEDGLVLLKNRDSTLPLKQKRCRILVVGEAAVSKSVATGGGSGAVSPRNTVTVLQGLKNEVEKTHHFHVSFDKGEDVNKTLQSANEHDVVILVLAASASEGSDRRTLSLGHAADRLASTLAKAKSKLVVVTISPGAFLMPWEQHADAVLAFFLPGQELGNALASVLLGKTNPSGKLPLSFPNADNEMKFSKKQYPGVNFKANYSEGLMVGYRWYNHHSIRPRFCFGHGLSYTTFEYADLSIIGRYISFTIKNVGPVRGAEVVQFYIDRSPLSTATEVRPVKELVHFEKHFLQPGETKLIVYSLPETAVRYWDSAGKVWQTDFSKTYELVIGASIEDIRLSGEVVFKHENAEVY